MMDSFLRAGPKKKLFDIVFDFGSLTFANPTKKTIKKFFLAYFLTLVEFFSEIHTKKKNKFC